jgi:hypothetical protein
MANHPWTLNLPRKSWYRITRSLLRLEGVIYLSKRQTYLWSCLKPGITSNNLWTQWSYVSSMLRLDLPWRDWNAPLYTVSPGWLSVQAHFAKRNGALCKNALSCWNNPVPTRPHFHSWLSHSSRIAIAVGRCWTHWLATTSARYEPGQEYVKWGEEDNAWNMACPHSQKKRWGMDPYVRSSGWSCFITALRSITDLVHDKMN